MGKIRPNSFIMGEFSLCLLIMLGHTWDRQMSVGVGGKIVQTPTSASHLNPSGLHI